jgi:hypothetical protein
MDWSIIGILILIIILATAALVLYIKFAEHRTSMYERRLQAEANYDARLMSAAKILSFGGIGFRVDGVTSSGRIIYEKIIIDRTNPEAPQVVNVDELNTKHDAIQLAADSRDINSGTGTQLATADKWQELGHRRDDWQAAVNWLASAGLVRTHVGKGIFTTHGNLDALILALAVRSLPPRSTVDAPPNLQARGNAGTLRNTEKAGNA